MDSGRLHDPVVMPGPSFDDTPLLISSRSQPHRLPSHFRAFALAAARSEVKRVTIRPRAERRLAGQGIPGSDFH